MAGFIRQHRKAAQGLFVLGVLLSLPPGTPAAAPAKEKDVTALVRKTTVLDQRLQEVCRTYCQGNQKAGALREIVVRRLGAHRYAVRGLATLLNQHALQSGYQLFSYTVEIEARGLLDDRTCELKVTGAEVKNDKVGLNKLAQREVGRTHRIEDCRRFLVGL